MTATSSDGLCQTVLDGLRHGDFSRLEPYFVRVEAAAPPILALLEHDCFAAHVEERAEALTCACFLGAIEVAEQLLAAGVPPAGGMATGLNAFHWAANRGQSAAVKLLLRHGAPLETRNAYEGTVLGSTVWAAVHEPRPSHPAIIEELLRAGADVREAAYPTGDKALDALLKHYGASATA
jgi:ankyrin repeat protein